MDTSVNAGFGIRVRGLRGARGALRRARALARAPLALFALSAACGNEAPARAPEGSGPSAGAAASSEPRGVFGTASPPVAGIPSVVTLRGAAQRAAAGPQPVMDQLGLVFTPTALIVRVGEPMAFTNSETIVHNVRVTHVDTDATILDVETDPDQRVEFVFEQEGGYEVTCDHHPGMRAFVYATADERAVFADDSGRFVLTDVPPGSYTLSAWSVEPARRIERTIQVNGPSTEVDLTAP